jgi:hypothetical protein
MNRTFTKQQVKNIEEAIVMWATVPPKNVYPGLDDWRDMSQEHNSDKVTCRTIACFGGWCCHWPEFKKQGLKAERDGRPLLNEASGSKVADQMFGDTDLFLPRGTHPADRHSLLVDDHTVVMNRLKTLLAEAKRSFT